MEQIKITLCKVRMYLLSIILIGLLISKIHADTQIVKSDTNPMTKSFCSQIKNSSCSCSILFGTFTIRCSSIKREIMIKVQPNTHILMECKNIRPNDYTLLPNINVGSNISILQIKKCPLPLGQSFKKILNRFNIEKLRTLQFQIYDSDLGGTFLREHFKGLTNLERLVISVKRISYLLPDDLFMDLKNLTWLDFKAPQIHISKDIFIPLNNLNHLELSGNKLEFLDEGIFHNQNKLLHLNLWNNNLKNLTKNTFEGLSSLIDLDLSTNNLTTFQPDVFELLKNLTNLNLNGNNFISLPYGLLKNNKKLTHFSLTNNEVPLLTLPNSFFSNLSNLQDIRIKCYLKYIPNDLFTNSTQLRNISLSNNEINSLPADILVDQINLLLLDLSHNALTGIPQKLFRNTRSLLILSLSYNYLTNISSGLFIYLQNLKELYLDNNQFHRFDPTTLYGTAQSLQILDLHNNKISFDNEQLNFLSNNTTLSYHRILFKELNHLNLQNNSITNISCIWPLFESQKLQKLDLSYNNISSFNHKFFQFLPDQLKLNLVHNSISRIDFKGIQYTNNSTISKNDREIEILLEFNPVICDCFILHFVQLLRKEIYTTKMNNAFKIISNDLRCSRPAELKEKLITEIHPKELICPLDPKLIEKCPSHCTCWIRLYDKVLIVNCSNIGIKTVPQLPSVEELQLNFISLHIENNQLTRLPFNNMSFEYEKVVEIYANHNNINELTKENIPKYIKIFDIANNNITKINDSVLELFTNSSDLKLSLSYNPWICSCNTLEFIKFVQKNSKIIQDVHKMYCTTTGYKLSSILPENLCSNNKGILVIITFTIAVLCLVTGIFVGFYYKYQQLANFWLYANNLCFWSSTKKEIFNVDKKYDAFVLYSPNDEDFVTSCLIPALQNGPIPFKLCLPVTDWMFNRFKTNQIATFVKESQRTIIILSSNFIENIWRKLEFQKLYTSILNKKRTHIIVIIYDEINDNEYHDFQLKTCLKIDTYIKWSDPWFWNKLQNAMPKYSKYHHRIKYSNDDKSELIKSNATESITTPPAIRLTKKMLTNKINDNNLQSGSKLKSDNYDDFVKDDINGALL